MPMEMTLLILLVNISKNCTENGWIKQEFKSRARAMSRFIHEEATMGKEWPNTFRAHSEEIRPNCPYTLNEMIRHS